MLVPEDLSIFFDEGGELLLDAQLQGPTRSPQARVFSEGSSNAQVSKENEMGHNN